MSRPLYFLYRNHEGKVATRRVTSPNVYHGCTRHHPEPQWLLRAFDLDRQAMRDFALRGVLAFYGDAEPPPPPWEDALSLDSPCEPPAEGR